MKIYPNKKPRQNKEWLLHLSAKDRMTRQIALWVAFISVFGFFIKLLFF